MRRPRSPFKKISYDALNAREKEVYNFHYIGALLAMHGFASYPIRDDWNGGDMFARHMKSGKTLTIQIKGRLTFDRKYLRKDLHIGFRKGDSVFIYPHDETLSRYLRLRKSRRVPLENNKNWDVRGLVHWGRPTKELMALIAAYELKP